MGKQARPPERKTILIVEDSLDFANLLKFLIEDEGEGVEGVIFPVEGGDIVTRVRDEKPMAVLMDLALRRKEGTSYIEELKADPETKDVPIVIITGRDLTQREIMDLEAKGIKYLRKGRVEINEIKKEIRHAAGLDKGPAPKPA
jgi:two-component system cell cycle response regulator